MSPDKDLARALNKIADAIDKNTKVLKEIRNLLVKKDEEKAEELDDEVPDSRMPGEGVVRRGVYGPRDEAAGNPGRRDRDLDG